MAVRVGICTARDTNETAEVAQSRGLCNDPHVDWRGMATGAAAVDGRSTGQCATTNTPPVSSDSANALSAVHSALAR